MDELLLFWLVFGILQPTHFEVSQKIDLLNYISHGIEKESELLSPEEDEEGAEGATAQAPKKKSALDAFCSNLVEKAKVAG